MTRHMARGVGNNDVDAVLKQVVKTSTYSPGGATLLVHGQVTIIFVVSVCLFVQSFSQPSSIRFGSN